MMQSIRSSALAAVAILVAVTQADYYIDPSSVPLSIREAWCENEKTTCPLICQQLGPQAVLVNTCDPTQLTYGCLCGNYHRPNVSEYTLTLPYFVCQEWGNQCVTGCRGNNNCASACRQNHPCGATDPKKYTSTASTATATAGATDETTVFTGRPGGGSTASGDEKGAGTALEAGQAYGPVIVMAGLFAGFALRTY